MSSARALFLVTSLAFSTGCSFMRDAPDECVWTAPIEFSDETKEWLGSEDWPDSAFEDFNQIGDHNELYRRNCD